MGRRATRNELLTDGVIALALFAGSLALLAIGEGEEGSATPSAIAVLLCALSALPLAARRFGPLPVFVVTTLASTLLYAVAEPVGPPLGPTLALFFVASEDDPWPAGRKVALAVVVVLFAGHVAVQDVTPGPEILYGIVLWTGVWIAGDRARLRRERMAALEERARRAEREAERERRLAAAEERGRIARDLHDSAGHAMNVILVHAGLGRIRSERGSDETREAFATIEEVARETVGEIDQMVRVLREDAALPDEVEPPPGLAALDGLVARHEAAGLSVSTSIAGERRAIPPRVDRAAYRILQEALTNAARHGDGSADVVLAFRADELELSVENPVDGHIPARPEGGGHGVVGMRERAVLLGGSLDAYARGGRFRLQARLPLGGGAA